MTKVIVRNGNVDSALRTFKQKTVKEGLLKEVRKKESYMKVNKKDIINFSNKIKIATTYMLEGGNNEE